MLLSSITLASLRPQLQSRLASAAPAADASQAAEASGAEPAPAAARAPAAAKPVGGIGLGLSAIWAVIAGFFRRLFGGGSKTATP